MLNKAITALVLSSALCGCAQMPPWLPTSGPSEKKIQEQPEISEAEPIVVRDITAYTAQRVLSATQAHTFSSLQKTTLNQKLVLGAGDSVEISIWETPPAALFGTASPQGELGISTTHANTLPEQLIGEDGTIDVPFAGSITVAGKTTSQVQSLVADKLAGKANHPQVLVRVVRNASANVTIVGEVAASQRMALTPKHERLLDALAAAGGGKEALDKLTVQLTRGDQVASVPLDSVIRSPKENIFLQADDIVTLLYQPYSVTVLGATGKNDELNFEAKGISLAQALARAGGVLDDRADAKGVFIFRFEDPKVFEGDSHIPLTPDGKVPTIYRADLKNPATFLIAQNFPIRDKDVLYVSNASASELRKFLNLILSAVYPVAYINNLVN